MVSHPVAAELPSEAARGRHLSSGDTPAVDLPFKLVAGALCLDFTNTGAWPGHGESREPLARHECLTRYPRLVEWAHLTGLLDAPGRERLLLASRESPGKADAVFARATSLRAALHWAFAAVAEKRPIEGQDMRTLNDELKRALAHLRITPEASGYAWGWSGSQSALDSVLWPIARSAADLLVSDRLESVRVCAGDPCGFLFLDTSAGGRRRWCVMRDCGNRAKARRHYRRSRAAGGDRDRSLMDGQEITVQRKSSQSVRLTPPSTEQATV